MCVSFTLNRKVCHRPPPTTAVPSSVKCSLHTWCQVGALWSFKRQISRHKPMTIPFSSPVTITDTFGAATLFTESKPFTDITLWSSPTLGTGTTVLTCPSCGTGVANPSSPSRLTCQRCLCFVVEDQVSRFPVLDFVLCYQATPVNWWQLFRYNSTTLQINNMLHHRGYQLVTSIICLYFW